MYSTGNNPIRSVIWSETFLGNGNGIVRTGPFANWQTPFGPLNRNIGMAGRLITADDVTTMMNMRSGGRMAAYLEQIHNAVHQFVGGHMNIIPQSPLEPTFFLHHAYVDYLWWKWQNRVGYPEAYRYPAEGRGPHRPDAPLINIDVGDGVQYTNAEGYSARWANMVSYRDSPTCFAGGSCGSSFLTCSSSRCASRETGRRNDRQLLQQSRQNSLVRKKRHLPYFLPLNTPQTTQSSTEIYIIDIQKRTLKPETRIIGRNCLGFSAQNDFRVDCQVDQDLWAYLPIKIIHLRPAGKVYNSYPIKRSNPDFTCDIYNPQNSKCVNNNCYPRLQKQTSYKHCQDDESGVFRVTIKSRGMNYIGSYLEYAILDNRQPVDSKISYIGFRKPTRGKASKVLLSVYDQCGKICQPKCLVPGTKPHVYRSCSGLLDIDYHAYHYFGDTYSEAVLHYWDFRALSSCPREKEGNAFVVFYCDYRTNWWPWKGC